MGNLLRTGGPAAVFGLLGLAVAMLSVGLAIVALEKDQSITPGAWVAFAMAVVFAALFVGASWYLWTAEQAIQHKVREIIAHIRSGLTLRNQMVLGEFVDDDAMEAALEDWTSTVLAWIEREEPGYATVFSAAAPGVSVGITVSGMSGKASLAIRVQDSRISALHELLRELRISR